MTDDFTHYYFAKVGNGNSYLNFAINNKPSFFYIGYSDHKIPKLEQKCETKIRDLHFLTLISNECQTKSRVITFSDEEMLVWNIVNPLRYMTKDEIENLLKFCANDKKMKAEIEAEGEKIIKALDVSLIKRVLRDRLPACIDSLSVHRYLNSGTFRYLYSANKDLDHNVMGDFFRPEKKVPLKVPWSSEMSIKETNFAFFVRKYFDWLCDDTNKRSFAATYDIKQENVFKIASSIMSPAQLETAASMFLMSLGLTLDVGIGKGLDVIDVRASVRHQNNSQELIGTIIAGLEKIMGAKLDPKIENNFRECGTISVQCKNYDYKECLPVLVFKPSQHMNDKINDGKTITLCSVNNHIKDLKNPNVWNDWISLLQFSYLQDKDALGLLNMDKLLKCD